MPAYKKETVMKRLIPFLLAVSALASCDMLDPFLYRVVTFGYPQSDNSFLGDDGYRYVFGSSGVDWQGLPRAVAVIDVSKEVSDTQREGKLVQFFTTMYKNPVVVTTPEIPDSLGNREINVSDVWYSGGCLNMYNVIRTPENGAGTHVVNLVVDKREPVTDTLRLLLRHRFDTSDPVSDVTRNYDFYSSFPLEKEMPERDSVVLKVSWTWDGKEYSTSGKVGI